jgi:hypothetical protein
VRTAPASSTLRRPLPSLLDRAHAFHFPLSPRWHAALAPDRLAHVRDPRPRRRTGGLRCTVHLLIRTVPFGSSLDSRSVRRLFAHLLGRVAAPCAPSSSGYPIASAQSLSDSIRSMHTVPNRIYRVRAARRGPARGARAGRRVNHVTPYTLRMPGGDPLGRHVYAASWRCSLLTYLAG